MIDLLVSVTTFIYKSQECNSFTKKKKKVLDGP